MNDLGRKLTAKEKKSLIAEIVQGCRQLADGLVSGWKPINREWPVVTGCAYLRLSHDDQVLVEKGSLEQQIHILWEEALVRSHQDKINYRISNFFIEPGVTGTHDRRPQFQTMFSEIKRGKHKFVLFKELSRIHRQSHLWKIFFQTCIKIGCHVFIRGFPLNPNDPTQILQLDILAAFAEYESSVNSKRVRETNYSALVSSGKLNSTRKILGLDPLIENGKRRVGFYQRNEEELKTLDFIMRTFEKYDSASRTLEELRRLQIKNVDGKPFLKNSLHTLLTNTRYIGKWEINLENKDKDPNKILPYDRHAIVDLPHGCVVDKALWDRIQFLVSQRKFKKTKEVGTRKIYPLSGLLRYQDGSPFHGTGAWGKTSHVTYYFCKNRKLRIGAEQLEDETKRVVSEIIRDSELLRDAIKRRNHDAANNKQSLANEMARIEKEISGLENERKALDKRLDFLLDGVGFEKAKGFKADYFSKMEELEKRFGSYKRQIENLKSKIADINQSASSKDIASRARLALEKAGEMDPLVVKAIYHTLFEAIVVSPSKSEGQITLSFVLKENEFQVPVTDFGGQPISLPAVTFEAKTSVEKKLAG